MDSTISLRPAAEQLAQISCSYKLAKWTRVITECSVTIQKVLENIGLLEKISLPVLQLHSVQKCYFLTHI